MAVFPFQPSFARGEISPRLHARADLEHWKIALAKAPNWITLRQGALRRRPGTLREGRTKLQGANDIVVGMPFNFAPGQAYMLELSHLAMRVWALTGRVQSGPTVYEVATPWLSTHLRELQFDQSNDVIYVTHEAYPPYKIQRYGETDWRLEAVALQDGPFMEVGRDAVTLRPSGEGFIIPQMPGPSTGDGDVFSSFPQSSNLPPGNPSANWHVFDRNELTRWMPVTGISTQGSLWQKPPWFLAFRFPVPRVVAGYAIQVGEKDSRAPRSWIFRGTTDGVNYTVLDRQTGVTGWGPLEWRYFTFPNKTAYTEYSLYMYSVNGAGTETQDIGPEIRQLQFMGAEADAPTVRLTATSTAGINGGQGFLSTDVGRQIRFLSSATYWHWFEITQRISSTVVDAKLRSPPLPNRNGSVNWKLGSFSGTTGYPRAVKLFQERVAYGGTPNQPKSVWLSRTGDFDNFSTSIPLVPDDALTFTLPDQGRINWLADNGQELMIGMSKAVRPFGAANKDEGLSASNFQVGKPVRPGGASMPPVQAGGVHLYVERVAQALRELVYDFNVNGYVAPDITVLSEHIMAAGVRCMAYAAEPNAIIWMAMEDGTLASLTYERDQGMVSITPHQIAGGEVEWLTVLEAEERDQVWMIVRRLLPNGSYVRTVERLAADFEADRMDRADAVYLDGAVTSLGGTFTGLSHLEGCSVLAYADGVTQGPYTVTGETLTVPGDWAKCTIGLDYADASVAETLRIVSGSGDGSGLGRKRKIHKVIFDIMETGALRVKASGEDYEETVLREASDPMDGPIPLKTGPVSGRPDDRWSGQGVVRFKPVGPQPCTIRAIIPAFEGEP